MKIGQAFGIGVFVHVTFPLVLIVVAYAYYQAAQTIAAAIAGIVFTLSVFAVVVLHELGHALAARRFGVQTRDITLLPIGGVARLERIPEEPGQELAIAVAGPAVNIVIAILIGLGLLALGRPLAPAALGDIGAGYFERLLWANVWLVLFNAIPAFPMDGGRVLRALLAMRMSHRRATEIAATVGKGFAVIFGVAGLLYFHSLILVLIAMFVWMGASGEASMARMRTNLGGALGDAVTIRDVVVLAPGEPLSRAVDYVLAGFQEDFPVLNEGRLVGLLTREDLLRALNASGKSSSVGEAMRAEFPIAAPDEAVETLYARLQTAGLRTLPVVSNGSFVGVITTENIAEYLMVSAALRGKGNQ